MAVNNNLFPPVVETYMPAFLIGNDTGSKGVCRIYFSISAYNSLNEIQNVQVAVLNQNTNMSILNKKKYPCEVMLTNLKIDEERTSDDKYYIEIQNDDIQDGFQINQYYKVQLRFTLAGTENPPGNIGMPPQEWDETTETYLDAQKIDSWLVMNLSNFSEWSTVCLIRGISTPSLLLNGFDELSNLTFLSLDNVSIVGTLTFENSAETDCLKNYQIKLYNTSNNLLFDTGLLYPNTYNNLNEINYTFEYAFNEGEQYYFTITYETMNMYKESLNYNFMLIQENIEKLNAILTAELDNENGAIILNLKGKEGAGTFIGNITIRRASSENNFTTWEDVHTTFIDENKKLDYTWTDYTIKSGIYYKYIAQKRTSLGNRGLAIHAKKEPFMILFDSMYLTGEEGQLKIRFDPSVNSFKRTVSESKTETIGNQYPFVKRNGYLNYKQFPIGGTISWVMDKDELFTSKQEIFKDSLSKYEEFNKENKINMFNDWTYEREFREKVMDFLYADKVRLFRSATEGNILIKLMDINFTPNATLGRRIYSFTATAYEIDECTVKNFDKYKIITIGNYNDHLSYFERKMGQFSDIIEKDINILDILSNKYENLKKEDYILKFTNFNYLRIEMEDPPYLIGEGENGPYVVDDVSPVGQYSFKSKEQWEEDDSASINPDNLNEKPADYDILLERVEGEQFEDLTKVVLGYLIYINEKPIIINPEGIYELSTNDLQITSITSPVDIKMTFNYDLNIEYTEDTSNIVKKTIFYKKVSQLWGTFEPNVSIYEKIWNKHYEKYDTYYQSLIGIDKLTIETDPYTVLYIKESEDEDFNRHIVGETGLLSLDNDGIIIEGLYFAGKHFELATQEDMKKAQIPENKYIETGLTIDIDSDFSESFIENGVYTLTNTFLDVLDRDDIYSFKSREQWESLNTASINQINIENEEDEYTLLLEESDADDHTVEIDEINFDEINSGVFIDGTPDSVRDEQIDLNKDSDIIDTQTGSYRDEYSFKSKEQWQNLFTASINNDNITEETNNYVLNLNQIYEKYFDLVLYKTDIEYALILNQLISSIKNRYIWYHNKWYPFTENHDCLCPTNALIDYDCAVVKGRYE